jgi:hypothetical protein
VLPQLLQDEDVSSFSTCFCLVGFGFCLGFGFVFSGVGCVIDDFFFLDLTNAIVPTMAIMITITDTRLLTPKLSS